MKRAVIILILVLDVVVALKKSSDKRRFQGKIVN